MKTGKTFLASASVLAVMATSPAFAGGFADPVVEPVIEPVAAAPVMRQGGNWGGFYAGGQLGYGSGSTGGVDLDGGLLGAHLGYNVDLGGYVLGAELDADLARLDLDSGERIDRIIRLKGRAGVDLGDTMLYGTAGVARARLDTGAGNVSDNGYFGGIGLDYAVSDSIIVGGEALVHRFDNFGGGPGVNATTLRAKMSFRF